MNAVPQERPEPVDRFAPGTGSGLSAILAGVLPAVREAAGSSLRSVVLAGSHATGEAVWASHAGRRVSLSDLDLYVVLRDADAVPRARRAWRSPDAETLLRAGLAAPAEAGFDTLEGFARMPARPGSVELARSARVVEGDHTVLAHLPRHEPGAISADERLRLLENRAFELLWARLVWAPGLDGLRAQHAVLKTALDLAAARALAARELPPRAAARVARAEELGEPASLPSWLAGAWPGLGSLWHEAVAWREGAALEHTREDFRRDWRATARGWAAAWWAESAGWAQGAREGEVYERALAVAARGSLARRLRHALRPVAGARAAHALAQRLARERSAGEAPAGDAWMRWLHATAGTPQLRLHGVAAVLVLAAAQAPGEPALPAGALHALRQLGFPRFSSFDDASRVALCSWGRPLATDALDTVHA